MLALVKMPHTEIVIHGADAADIFSLIKSRYPIAELVESSVPILSPEQKDDDLVDIAETEWWKQNRFRVLRGCRNRHGISQAELAKRSGISRSVIALYEGGKRRISSRAAEKLGRALGENPLKFLSDSEI